MKFADLEDCLNAFIKRTKNLHLISQKQKDYEKIYGVGFPKFKIMDMALWQKGYDIENLLNSK